MMQDIPTPRAFRAIRSVSVAELTRLSESELRPLLPCLVRMALCSPLDESPRWTEARKEIQKILSGMDVVSSIVALLSVDFSLLEQDALKEQQLRRKVGGGVGGASVLVESLQNGLALEFERSEPARRLRLILSELLRIMSQVSPDKEFLPEKSEIFECEVYLEEVSDVICIAQAELPSLLQLDKIAEVLLRVKYGPWLLCRLVANAPDNFEQVCLALLSSGEIQDESSLGGMIRTQALRQLCAMNPHHALVLRSAAVRLCRLPGLAVALTYDMGSDYSGQGVGGNDLVAFLSGLLLGSDTKVRSWFAEFVRVGQKKSSSSSVLSALRNQLLKEVSSLVPSGVRQQLTEKKLQMSSEVKPHSTDRHHVSESHADKETLEILQAMDVSTDFEVLEEKKPDCDTRKESFGSFEINEGDVLRASALLRLYCALKGLAGMKLTNQEAEELLCLITCHPPPTATGVRFVVVGLCTLLACTYIVSSPEHEQVAVKWIKWLSKEEYHYETASGVHASFGEILLLVAIHFHSNQVEAITELVCSTLGMKIRLGHLSRMKTLFTQELFTEKVVTAHGVTVPVTPELSADVTGFLPIHCIHQLLKSRAFTKHSVPVKDWVYKQICSCTTPLHPLMSPLVEAFVHSIINPLSANRTGRSKLLVPTVEGFTETEVASVFQSAREELPMEVETAKAVGLRRRSSVWVTSEEKSPTSLAPQLLMLYYVLTYQDCLLSNMKTIASSSTQYESYSSALLAKIPIKHLLQKARSQQAQFRGLYAPMLRLLVTHYPHLCRVGDWLVEEQLRDDQGTDRKGAWSRCLVPIVSCSPKTLHEALSSAVSNPSQAMLHLNKLGTLEPSSLIPYVDVLVQSLPLLLEPGFPRRIQALCCNLWSSLNTVIPRKLWLATVNSLCHADGERDTVTPEPYTDEDLMRDPLTVLRCDRRVFRCPPLFDVMCRILTAYLAASRALFTQHLQSHPAPKGNNAAAVEQEREELRRALVDAQESAAIQILLEICLPSLEDKQGNSGSMKACELREIQCRVCSLLHQMFIADPNIAKLVHFQGYPSELLSTAVAGIPSMHICLDFIPELINQPQLEKQLFAVQLASYLSLQYPLPKAMGVAKYILSRMTSLLAALPASKRASFFIPALPALVLFCRAFPPLCGDTCVFLVQLGKVASSHATASTNHTLGERSSLLQQLLDSHNPLETADPDDHGFTDEEAAPGDNAVDVKPVEYFTTENENKLSESEIHSRDVKLCQAIEKTFADLVNIAVLKKQECV